MIDKSMQLLPGVEVSPRYSPGVPLIGTDKPAFIRIRTGPHFAGNAAYAIKPRAFGSLLPFYLGDWKELQWGSPPDEVYSGAEHRGAPKQPNITVVPDWPVITAGSAVTVAGSTMGHDHTPIDGIPPVQEVYEFHSFGIMLLGNPDGLELSVADPGAKVVVPPGDHMALFNLGGLASPLVTLDFAHPSPERNPATKDRVKKLGPAMLLHYDEDGVWFTFNSAYEKPLGCDPSRRQVRIPLAGRMKQGEFLYQQLTSNPDVIAQFARVGVRIRVASPEARLLPGDGRAAVWCRLPLQDLANPGSALYSYFIPGAQPPAVKRTKASDMVSKEATDAERRASVAGYQPLERRMVVLVEGTGDWAFKAYRTAFKLLATRGISVFYANDETWDSRPDWASEDKLEPWEIYLNKADSHDFAIYQNLVPDVVFVVTPDFTHAQLARFWAERRRPLICVEKPFDSQLANVDSLVACLGRNPVTAILGLDHYQLRARLIHDYMPEIAEHLGGALMRAVFYMTEAQRLEAARAHTLQYGLTLDMLPHLFALIPYFGELASVDEIRVLDTRRYFPFLAADKYGQPVPVPPVFRAETYSNISFTFSDYSGSGVRVSCEAIVGKGLIDRKYFEVIGQNGNAIRIDFNKRPASGEHAAYPWGELIFVGAPNYSVPVQQVTDPFGPGRRLRVARHIPMEPTAHVYRLLLEDLLRPWEERQAIGRTLLLPEAREIVRALDRIWTAIQEFRAGSPEWRSHDFGKEPESGARPAAAVGGESIK
jgi:predicted dehydrogenase